MKNFYLFLIISFYIIAPVLNAEEPQNCKELMSTIAKLEEQVAELNLELLEIRALLSRQEPPIKSLSIVVPSDTGQCINNCRFCVSRMRNNNPYKNRFKQGDNAFFDAQAVDDFLNRLAYARDRGSNSVMLTGENEPQQNRAFLELFGNLNRSLLSPFKIVEIQTTGAGIDKEFLEFLRTKVGVTTISLSISSFNNNQNRDYNRTSKSNFVNIKGLCKLITGLGFNLRISINMTNAFNNLTPQQIFYHAKQKLGAHQITFRVLYTSAKGNTLQDAWIRENKAQPELIARIKTYIRSRGRELEHLEYGRIRYSVNGLSVVLDEDCMSTQALPSIRYLIFRPDGHLYTKWDDQGSLLY